MYINTIVSNKKKQCGVCLLDCIKVEEEFELYLPDGEVTVHGAVGASELINTAKSGSGSIPPNPATLSLLQLFNCVILSPNFRLDPHIPSILSKMLTFHVQL